MTKAAELAKMGEVLTNSQIGGRRNIVINGGMQISQRATSATGVGSGFAYPTLDRYKIVPSTSGRATMSQSTDAPDGFANSLKLECTTADTSIAAGEYFNIRQSLEGQDVQQLKKGTSSAEKITVSFYVKGNASATYLLELSDQDNTRYNGQTFAVTTSWNRIVLTYNGDTSGVLDNDNARSLDLNFWLHGGSTYTGGTFTSNTWHGTDNQRLASITSFFDSTDREFFITGLQMEVGSQATPFEHRSFGEELALCQRYFYKTQSDSTYDFFSNGVAVSSTLAYNGIALPCKMRSAPTLTTSGNLRNYRNGGSAITTIAINHTSAYFCVLECTSSGGGLTAGDGNLFGANNDADAAVMLSAEL
jgi:hypothetical protein